MIPVSMLMIREGMIMIRVIIIIIIEIALLTGVTLIMIPVSVLQNYGECSHLGRA